MKSPMSDVFTDDIELGLGSRGMFRGREGACNGMEPVCSFVATRASTRVIFL